MTLCLTPAVGTRAPSGSTTYPESPCAGTRLFSEKLPTQRTLSVAGYGDIIPYCNRFYSITASNHTAYVTLTRYTLCQATVHTQTSLTLAALCPRSTSSRAAVNYECHFEGRITEPQSRPSLKVSTHLHSSVRARSTVTDLLTRTCPQVHGFSLCCAQAAVIALIFMRWCLHVHVYDSVQVPL